MTRSLTAFNDSILVLTAGWFGEQVGARLVELHGAVVQAIGSEGTHPSLWPHAELIVLASSYERSDTAELIDRTCFSWKRRWFPIVASATSLTCGPLVLPGSSACYQCFLRRRQQHRHRGSVELQDTLSQIEVAHPPHHIEIAVALASQAIEETRAGSHTTGLGGTVRMFNQVSGTLIRSQVVAVNRCARCRPPLEREDEGPLWQALRSIRSDIAQEVTTG